MQIEFRPEDYIEITCDLLAYPVFEEETAEFAALEALNRITNGAVQSVLSSGEFKPEIYQTCRIFKPVGLKARYLLLVGAGKKSQFNPSRLRETTGVAVRNAKSIGGKTVAFLCRGDHAAKLASRLATEGVIYANYEFDIYKTRNKDQRDIDSFWVLFEPNISGEDVRESIRRGIIVGETTNFSRTLANEPANILTPSQFAERALQISTRVGLSARIMDREEMEKLGMNALLAVSRGSEESPKMIVLQIPKEQEKKQTPMPLYAFVGKGITFDSGGISIKPSDKMEYCTVQFAAKSVEEHSSSSAHENEQWSTTEFWR